MYINNEGMAGKCQAKHYNYKECICLYLLVVMENLYLSKVNHRNHWNHPLEPLMSKLISFPSSDISSLTGVQDKNLNLKLAVVGTPSSSYVCYYSCLPTVLLQMNTQRDDINRNTTSYMLCILLLSSLKFSHLVQG